MKHIFVVNPCAGQDDSTEQIKALCKEYIKDGNYELYVTKGQGDATTFVKNKLAEDDDVRFYACGGDGTLNEVVCGIGENKKCSLSVYPCGSGNDFVKYYGGKDVFLDFEKLVNAEAAPIDLMKIGERYCINVCNFGFDTTVAKTMIKVKRNKILGGSRAYVTGVVTALLKAMKNEVIVKADGEQLNTDKILLCTLANGNYVGGSFKCAPRSKDDDGLLEVCLIKKISRFRFVSLLGPYTAGEHLDTEKFKDCIVYRQAKKIEIDAPKGFSMSVDGEIVDGTHFEVELLPGAINFAAPGVKVKED